MTTLKNSGGHMEKKEVERIEKETEILNKMILDKYAKYYEILQKLGKYPFEKVPTVREIELPSGIYQRAFSEMKKEKFKGTIMDYFYSISLLYITKIWEDDIWKKLEQEGRIKEDVPEKIYIKDAVNSLIAVCLNKKNDSKNMARLVLKNPDYLFSTIYIDYYKQFIDIDIEEAKYLIYKTIAGLRYLDYANKAKAIVLKNLTMD
jgi:hypothetical protein